MGAKPNTDHACRDCAVISLSLPGRALASQLCSDGGCVNKKTMRKGTGGGGLKLVLRRQPHPP